jgi:tRNA modification GTPase
MTVAFDVNDTIAAIASPHGPALRGIVRLSGPRAIEIALGGFEADRGEAAIPLRRAVALQGRLRVDGLRPMLPATVSLWPAPRTYTGQNVAEIHTVGSTPLMSLLLAHCLSRGARTAEPGEFTLRAFLAGRIDLTRAEAVLGVIDARSSARVDAALAQLAGGLATPVLDARNRMLDVLAHLEANLDFTDEPDVDPLERAHLLGALDLSAGEIANLIGRLSQRDRPEALPRVVLTGPPNVGKSRLFNALVGQDQAIVSSLAGTTRDYLTARCDCDGLSIELIDTAGVEEHRDTITQQAQTFRAEQTGTADLVLECRSAGISPATTTSGDRARRVLDVWTKADESLPVPNGASSNDFILTSAVTGAGVAALRSAIARELTDSEAGGDLPAGTSARCRGSLLAARDALQAATATLDAGGGDELVAVDLRRAIDELGKVVGIVVTDDILDRIFSRFCIGK